MTSKKSALSANSSMEYPLYLKIPFSPSKNVISLLQEPVFLKPGWHYASLERIFIENRIYRDIEDQETWPGVINAIDKGLQPHITHLKRGVTQDNR